MTDVAGDRPVLWQFRFSHFNEKARWALDWKGIAHVRRSLQVIRPVSSQERHVAVNGRVGRINITEDPGLGGIKQPLIAAYIDLRPRLLTLILIEDAERAADAGADGVVVEWIVERGIVRDPPAKRRIGRSIGSGKLVVGLRQFHGLHRRFEVWPRLQRGVPKLLQRHYLFAEIVRSGDIELFHGSAVIQ